MFKNKLAVIALLVSMFGVASNVEAGKASDSSAETVVRKCSCGKKLGKKDTGSDYCSECRCTVREKAKDGAPAIKNPRRCVSGKNHMLGHSY